MVENENRVRALQAQYQELLPEVLRARAALAEPERAEKAMKRVTEIARTVTLQAEGARPELALGRITEIVFQYNGPLLTVQKLAELQGKLDALSAAAAPQA